MRASAQTEAEIARQMIVVEGDASPVDRAKAGTRVIRLREPRLRWAQRISVETMPEAQSKAISYEAGKAKKAELVAAAKARNEEALRLHTSRELAAVQFDRASPSRALLGGHCSASRRIARGDDALGTVERSSRENRARELERRDADSTGVVRLPW